METPQWNSSNFNTFSQCFFCLWMTMPFGCGISISAFEDLYKDETFASYSQVSLRFNRTKGHLFRYLQICYFVRKNFKDLVLLPAKTLQNNILEVCFYISMSIWPYHRERDWFRLSRQDFWGRNHPSSICTCHSIYLLEINLTLFHPLQTRRFQKDSLLFSTLTAKHLIIVGWLYMTKARQRNYYY